VYLSAWTGRYENQTTSGSQTAALKSGFLNGRPSRHFRWDDIAGRRLRPVPVDGKTAREEARTFARAQRNKLG
jgi:hypothetical protein